MFRFLLPLLVVACAPPTPRAPALAPVAPGAPALSDEAGRSATLGELVRHARLTVLVFMSSECPVQKAHTVRLRDLVAAYPPAHVAFAAVVSEVGSDMTEERGKARSHGLGMPVWEDRNAVLADALGIEFSTHAVLLDRERHILYSGALDSDRVHLTPGAEPFLRSALDASLSGTPVAKARTEPLGCPLRKH